MKGCPPATLDPLIYGPVIDRALREDLGDKGDVTTTAVVPPDTEIKACLATREAGRVAGLPVALEVFRRLDPEINVRVLHDDGADVGAGTMIATVEGPARPILTGERTALNILTRLCGIATATRRVVEAIQPYPTRVACTRKTTPGLRALEKYAVRIGGGINHRFGLYDGVLIKDNHIVAAGGLRLAVERARTAFSDTMKIEVEIDSLDQLALSIEAGADAVLLDNLSPDQVREAVRLAAGRVVTEASGGIRPDTVRAYAATGVDLISLGWLTHSTAGLDIGLDFKRV
ncbi:MAG: carboxylating nicotinate-nucleotide diphosphorylase [Acidobacteriota bacterium]